MTARLVRIGEGRRGQAVELDAEELLIGRDPRADLPLPDASTVSVRHALVRREGSRHVLIDLGSTNGTTLNGERLREPRRLEAGDRIGLAGAVTLVYERPGHRVWLPLAVLALAIGAGMGLYQLWPRTDAVIEEAATIAELGLTAWRAGEAAKAKAELRRAAGLLYNEGRLDHVERHSVIYEAMALLEPRFDEVDLVAVYKEAELASRPRPPQPRGDERCRLDEVRSSEIDPCLREWVQRLLYDLRQDPSDVPGWFYRDVGRTMRRENEGLGRALERGRELVPMLRRELEAAHMPALLHYVALIESYYRTHATSRAGAVGLWQLLRGTAREYGLRVDGSSDQRKDPLLSSRAAAGYLNDLAFEFGGGSLLLVLAAYNRGQNGLRRDLKKQDDPFSDRSYWRLVERELIPAETARYVARFMAAAVAGEAGLPTSRRLEEGGF